MDCSHDKVYEYEKVFRATETPTRSDLQTENTFSPVLKVI